MNRIWMFAPACLLAASWMLSIGPSAAHGEEPRGVPWQTDVLRAWQSTQRQNRPLLVFVTRADCFYCTKMELNTWSHGAIAGAVDRSYVPLLLDGGSPSALLAELKVSAYPCTFVISPQAVVLERFEGYVAPEVLAGKLAMHSPPPASPPILPVARVVKDP